MWMRSTKSMVELASSQGFYTAPPYSPHHFLSPNSLGEKLRSKHTPPPIEQLKVIPEGGRLLPLYVEKRIHDLSRPNQTRTIDSTGKIIFRGTTPITTHVGRNITSFTALSDFISCRY